MCLPVFSHASNSRMTLRAVEAVRLEVGRALDQIDRRAELLGLRAGLERVGERACGARSCRRWRTRDRRGGSAPCASSGFFASAFSSCSAAALGSPERASTSAMRPAISLRSGRRFCEALELRDRGLPVVPRERAIEVDLGVRIELLDARGDLVGLGERAVVVERARGTARSARTSSGKRAARSDERAASARRASRGAP